MFHEAEDVIKKLKTENKDHTERIATLENQMSEVIGKLNTALNAIQEMKEKQEQQEREDEYSLPSELH